MSELRILQMPEPPRQLFLLYHGVGSTPDSLLPLGRRLAREFPQAAVVGVPAPHRCDGGAGLQWFSVAGIDDGNRAPRVAAALPAFIATVHDWQARTGVGPAATALVGFSQGAIMALAATQSACDPPLAGRVAAIAGRFGAAPTVAPPTTSLHLLHARDDRVVDAAHAEDAAARLAALGADATLDLLDGGGHAPTAAMAERLVERLKTHVPQHLWRAATDAATSPG